MAWYSPRQVANVWYQAGGSSRGVIMAVAVAFAESGGNTSAVSPSSDYGLWQINAIHFGDGIIGWNNWASAGVNAREAIKISGNGSNWAAWCTMWANPARDCGHGHITYPQSGSAVARTLPQIERALGGTVAPPPGRFPVTISQQLDASWNDHRSWVTTGSNRMWWSIERIRRASIRLRQQ